jgi:electron transport complex protein RnfC
VSTTLHSPVTGTVVAVAPRRNPGGQMVESVEIEADPYSMQQVEGRGTLDWRALDLDEFIDSVQQSGLVGLGGAAFPAHVKYKLPEGRRCERLVINGCECEPYLTGDHRTMVERAGAVVRGTEILATMLAAGESVIGVELNKADAIAALNRQIPDGARMRVAPLKVKYPQGAEKMLIKAVYGLEVPAGKLPIDVNIVVNNVGSMAALADWFDRGVPLIERAVTVAGPGVQRPSNLIVPIGTPVRDVLQHCGINHDTRQVIMGGPMMGTPLASLDVPTVKGTSGLLAFTEQVISHATEYACLRCGRCLEACGNFLNPARLARLARAGRWEDLEQSYVMDCMECGACTFACPSAVPVVHLIRAAKAAIRHRKAKDG